MTPTFLSRHWAGSKATYNTRRRLQRSGRKGLREALSMRPGNLGGEGWHVGLGLSRDTWAGRCISKSKG